MAEKPKMMAEKKSLSTREFAKKGFAIESKRLLPSILINGKLVKSMKMSSGPKSKDFMFSTSRETSNLGRKLYAICVLRKEKSFSFLEKSLSS